MRLEHYLTEGYKSISEDDIDVLIQKDCKPFLRQITKFHLYRGIKINYTALKVIPRTERMPKDTPIEMHNLFDNIAKEMFGWKPRAQGVFATGGTYQAQTYGTVYEIYPIGNFKFLYAPNVHDFYTEFRGQVNLYRLKHSLQSWPAEEIIKKPGFKSELTTFIKANYTDKDLYKAAMYENEIMILCKSYYGKRYDDIIEM